MVKVDGVATLTSSHTVNCNTLKHCLDFVLVETTKSMTNKIKYIPISSSTWQHLIDTNDMERMKSHTNVELVFTAMFHHVFIGTNTSSFQSFRWQLFIFIRYLLIITFSMLWIVIIENYLQDVHITENHLL